MSDDAENAQLLPKRCDECDCPIIDEECLRWLSRRGDEAMARLNRHAPTGTAP